jgi:DNA-binding XRE family transcriptional regulator
MKDETALSGDSELLTPTLIKAARILLGYDQKTLSKKVGVSTKTLSLIETMKAEPLDPRRRRVLEDMRRKMENELLVEFVFASDNSGEGVRIRRA